MRERDAIPTGRARRGARMTGALGPASLRVIGTLAVNLRRSPERARELIERRHEQLAENALAVLGDMRGGAMKVGQLASFIDVALIPPEYRGIYQEKLAALRDSAPPMPWTKVRSVLEGEWDEPVESLFESFEHDAVAAASIGQVHRAVLPGGRRVAVKVQYPEVADALAADVDLAAIGVRLAKAVAPGIDPALVVGELRERILEELDYELEAQHQRMFARAYRGHPFVEVPAVVTELSRRRVLVADWVDGRPFAAMVDLPQPERDRIGEIIQRFYFGAMHRIGRFNTDPHPGNFLLLDDGRMAFLDFGNVKDADPDWLAATIRAIEAALDRDVERFRDELTGLGYLRRPARVDAERLLEQTLDAGEWFLSDREITIDRDYVARLIERLTADPARDLRTLQHVSVPPEEIWLRRLSISVPAVLAQLRARRNWHRVARELWFGEEPASELGAAEREFWNRR